MIYLDGQFLFILGEKALILTSEDIKNVLIQHQVEGLFHANTVLTSISFLKNQGLCSRQYISQLPDSYQTGQYSDADDQRFGIYNDIFFDSVDIHHRAHRCNQYGPVTFIYSLNLLSSPALKNKVRVTKDNPIRWKTEMNLRDRYFINLVDLQNGFCKGNFSQHITLHDVQKISFQYLRFIQIDSLPEKYHDIFNNAYQALKNAVNQAGLPLNVIVRACDSRCQRQKQYLQMSKSEIIKKYSCGVDNYGNICSEK